MRQETFAYHYLEHGLVKKTQKNGHAIQIYCN